MDTERESNKLSSAFEEYLLALMLNVQPDVVDVYQDELACKITQLRNEGIPEDQIRLIIENCFVAVNEVVKPFSL